MSSGPHGPIFIHKNDINSLKLVTPKDVIKLDSCRLLLSPIEAGDYFCCSWCHYVDLVNSTTVCS